MTRAEISHITIVTLPPTGRQKRPRNQVTVHLIDGRRYVVDGLSRLPGYRAIRWRLLLRYGVRVSQPRDAWDDVLRDGIERGWAQERKAV